MPSFQTGGSNVHYREAGSGDRVLLLLHAFPLHAGMWELTPLAKAGWRVLAPDARGFDRSGPGPDILEMDSIAGDAAALLDSLGVKKAVVGGLSMGGYAAFALWRARKDLFRGLVLADTKPGADDAEGAAKREVIAKNALEKGMDWIADQLAPKLQRTSPLPAADAAIRTMIKESTSRAFAAGSRGLARRADSKPTLATIDVPTLIVVGAEDSITPPAEAKAMHEAIRGSTLIEIPAAGHLANIEQPDAFNAALLRWLAER
jgi:3-oxoadipate enol-lactonase